MIKMGEDFSFLKGFTLFSNLDQHKLIEIGRLLEYRSYPADTTLFFQGDIGENIYFLRKGRVKALKSNSAGEEQILEILQAGDVFGEVVLFGVEEYPATAVAMGDVEVVYLPRTRFKEYLFKNPELGWGMLEEMAEKLRRAQEKIENLGLRDTRGRVASLLIDLLYKFGDSEKEPVLKYNRQEMANLIGTTRETVSRTLSEFRNNGLLQIEGSRIYIKDLEGLKEYI